MVLAYSPDGNVLYARLHEGEVAETAEFRENVYVDLDAEGLSVGVEFLDAGDFFPFLEEHFEEARGTVLNVPAALTSILDRRYGADSAGAPLVGVSATDAAVTVAPS